MPRLPSSRQPGTLSCHSWPADRSSGSMSLETIKAQTLVTFFRSGGPGGQHRNKTETAVRLVHGPTGVTVVAADERSQRRNLTLAFDRLRRKLIARSAVPRRRIPTRTPTSVREARLDAKRRRAQKKIFRRRPDET
jgi:ribosome-associated protein